MRTYGTLAIRLVFLGVLAVCVVAVGLGRLVPGPGLRVGTNKHPALINGFLLDEDDPAPRVLDGETGDLRAVSLPAGDNLEQASFAPWSDEVRGLQCAGRWWRADGDRANRLGSEFGLARY